MAPRDPHAYDRRSVLLGGAALLALPGCATPKHVDSGATPAASDGVDGDDPSDGTDGSDGGDGTDGTDGSDGTDGTDGTGDGDDGTEPAAWATGGTAAVDVAHYPDPFADGAAASCTLTCLATLGPCHAEVNLDRQDVSEGVAGLPTLYAFRLVRAEDCRPVPDAEVEIWMTDREGRYSGPTTQDGTADGIDSTMQCHGGEATAVTFQRGTQTTDSDGIVRFHGVFPGWYPGRAIHVHLRVREAGGFMLTTQFYMDDTLADEVFATHDDYSHRPGEGRTRIEDERHSLDMADYTFATTRTDQGALVAAMEIGLRRMTSEDICRD